EIPVVTGISKPLNEPVEPDAPPSVFDSVRIMEGEGLAPDTSADTVIPGRHETPEVAEPAPEQPAVVSAPVEPPPAPRPADHSTGSVDSDGRRSAKLKPLPEGTVLNNRYEIVRKIGGGGMGAVYLASDNNLGGVLRAVKEMVQAHIEEDQQEK